MSGTKRMAATEEQLTGQQNLRARTEQKKSAAEDLHQETRSLAAAASSDQVAHFPQLAALRAEALGEQQLTVESCDNREREMRDWLQTAIDAEDRKIARLRDGIIKKMSDYSDKYTLETREVDVAVEAADDYREMLRQLRTDDLPRLRRGSRSC